MNIPFDRRHLTQWLIVSLLISGLLLLVYFFSAATLSIETEAEAEIYVSQNNEPFSRVGVGAATFKTYSDETVFVEARKGEAISQTTASPKRFRTIEVNLELRDLAPTEKVAIGPFIYPHIEGGFIYGINPRTNSLSVKALSGNNKPTPTLPLLPFLKQVIWFSKNDFVYVTIGRGAGAISKTPEDSHGDRLYSQATRVSPDDRSIALLEGEGVFLSPQGNLHNPFKIADTIDNSQPSLFAHGQFIFFSSLLFESVEDEGDTPEGKETMLTLFDQKGNEEYKFTLPVKEPLLNIVQINPEQVGLLTASGVKILDIPTGEVREQKFSFGEVRDFVIFKDRLLLLGEAGLWEYDIDDQTFYKLASFPSGEKYVGQSLSIVKGSLYFSSSITGEALKGTDLTANSYVYQVELD